jgi:hypothetical protein
LDSHESVEQATSNIVPDNKNDSVSGEDEGNTDGKNGDGNADNNANMDMDEDNHDDSKRQRLESVDINRAHELCNHPGEMKLQEMARVFGWKLTGVLKIVCKGESDSEECPKDDNKKVQSIQAW